MPFKGLAFFADVERKVAKTHRHTVTTPKVMVIFTQVRAYLLCLKTVKIRFILHAKIKVFYINVKVT